MRELLVELILGLFVWIFSEVKSIPADSCEDGEAAGGLEESLKKRLAKEGWTEWQKTTGSTTRT